MGLRFIIGRAGSGKTHTCLQSILMALRRSQTGHPLLLLVPEQATFQMERALVSSRDLRATARAQVLSFRRLAWRVLSEVGGSARDHVGETGRRMILRALVEDLGDDLELFGRVASQPGFIERLSRTIGELRHQRIGVPELDGWLGASGDRSSLLARKVSDLKLVLDGLDRALSGRLLDPDDYLDLLSDRLGGSSLVRDAEVWVDGFAGFTPQEYAVLGELMRTAGRVHVALCLDPDDPRPVEEGDLFHPTFETRQTLVSMALDLGVDVEEPVVLGELPRFEGVPDIAHLERHFDSLPPEPYDGPVSHVTITSAPTRRVEVEWTAREMIRLVREGGLRWRDISLMVRDLDRYSHLLSTVLSHHGIPAFMDHKRPLGHHPVVELIRSGLELAGGWPGDAVSRLLKTDLLPLGRTDADILENYILAHGIRGTRWTSGGPWRYRRRYSLVEAPPEGDDDGLLQRVNAAREVVVDAMAPFVSGMAEGGQTVATLVMCVHDLLERLRVRETLEGWEREARQDGNLELAREHAQVWGAVSDLLDQAKAALGDRATTPADFARVMESGLESIRLGLIPPSLDQVLVGSIDRSRQPDVRAAFVLGVVDGEFPDPCPDEVIFSDSERRELAETGLDLAPGGAGRLLREQFLAYVAVTRPRERLYVTYPTADDGGKALMPSALVPCFLALLPDLEVGRAASEPAGTGDDVHFLSTPGSALGSLVTHARSARDRGSGESPLWIEVYRWLSESASWRERSSRALRSLRHTGRVDSLPADLAGRLAGDPLVTSVSRLEAFGRCPFSHFLGHVVRLRERPLHRLGPVHLGSFFHAALHLFTETLLADGRDIGGIDDEYRRTLMKGVVDRLAPALESEILMSSARHRHLVGVIGRRLDRAASVLGEHARRGRFRPVCTEMSFGPGSAVPPLALALRDGSRMLLRGQVDLVEAAEIDGEMLVRIVDYKSGRAVLDHTGIYHGLDLQLVTYLTVVLEHARVILGGDARPAGALYFPVRDPLVETGRPVSRDEAEAEIMKLLGMRGLVIDDPKIIRLMSDRPETFIGVRLRKDGTPWKGAPVASADRMERLPGFCREVLSDMGGRLRAGEISPRPYRRGGERACTHCDYRAACGFDVLIDGCDYRVLRPVSADDFWTAIEGGGGGERHQVD